MIPAVLFRVHSGLELGRAACRAAPAAAGQTEPALLQHVERLLDEGMFQEVPRRVSVPEPVVRVARLVERLPENLATQRHLAAHQDARQLAELHVCEPVPSELEAPAVPDSDAAALSSRLSRVSVARGRLEPGQRVVSRLAGQPLVLAETLRESERAVPKVVEDVAEEDAVSVEEDATAGVARMLRVVERAGQRGVRLAEQSVARRGVVHAAHVELHRRPVRHDGSRAAQCRPPRVYPPRYPRPRSARVPPRSPSITHTPGY